MKAFDILDTSPIARTNTIDIRTSLPDAISALLEFSEANDDERQRIAVGHMSFARERQENTTDFNKRIHREIKAWVRRRLDLPHHHIVRYVISRFWRDKRCNVFFFYLSDRFEERQSELIASVLLSQKDLMPLFAGLLNLCLKLSLIRDLAEIYDITQENLNSDYYLGGKLSSVKKSKFDLITAYELDLDCFAPPHTAGLTRVQVNLHRRAFKSDRNQKLISAALDDDTVIMRKGDVRYPISDVLDARKWFKDRSYFDVKSEGYHFSQNHVQNLILDRIEGLLNWLDLDYEPLRFQSNFGSRGLFTFNSGSQLPVSPVLIDSTSAEYQGSSQHQKIIQEIKSAFGINFVLSPPSLPKLTELDRDTPYLILNESRDDGSSIRLGDEELGTFWDAYKKVRREAPNTYERLDYYTALKIDQVRSDQHKVMQGWNASSDPKELDQKALKPKMDRTKVDLWLKYHFYSKRSIEPVALDDQSLALFYVRKSRNNRDFLASVIEVEVHQGRLEVRSIMRLDDEEELLALNPCLESRRNKLFNDSFFMYDRAAGHLLMTYANRMPVIVGNPEVDLVDLLNQNGVISRQIRDEASIALPYYFVSTSKTKGYQAYLQDTGANLLYFIPSAQGANQKIARQNLVYNLLVFDDKGQLLRALDQPITATYFRSMTFDVLRLKENSKMSLFQKLARLPIEN